MTIRLALSAAALLTFGGTLTAMHSSVHAEETALPLAAAEMASAVSTELPRFSPSAQIALETGFAAEPAEVAPQPLALEPVEQAIDNLGDGVASYYGKRFAGRPTASGETFDPAQFTAAHRTLPFGSRVRVTNPANGESVVVRINDRGPYHGNRAIDLSRAAAEKVGLVHAGHGTVALELLANS